MARFYYKASDVSGRYVTGTVGRCEGIREALRRVADDLALNHEDEDIVSVEVSDSARDM